MIPEVRACSLPPHTTWSYLTNRTDRENAGALPVLQTSDIRKLCEVPGLFWRLLHRRQQHTAPRFMAKSHYKNRLLQNNYARGNSIEAGGPERSRTCQCTTETRAL
jgi:hypothetical protein